MKIRTYVIKFIDGGTLVGHAHNCFADETYTKLAVRDNDKWINVATVRTQLVAYVKEHDDLLETACNLVGQLKTKGNFVAEFTAELDQRLTQLGAW